MALSILLVDDDPDFADCTAELLSEYGHRVSIAPDGATATVLARDLEPDVVLLDLRLPDVDGYELAWALRRGLPATTSIIALTGVRGATQTAALDLMLNKPIQGELFGGLVTYMHGRRQRLIGDGVR